MSPYVFRHYDGTNDPQNPREYNFTYDYDYRKPKRRETHHHHHHHYHMSPREDRRRINHSEDHLIHYLPSEPAHKPARSLPPLMYVPESPARYGDGRASQIQLLKARSQEIHPPRMVVGERRRHWDMESNICLGTCPRKSNKKIPSMFYDRLRCPHCLAHVQPSQGEVQAYPWTLVNYHPRRSGPFSEPGLDLRSKAVNPGDSLAGESARNGPSDISVQRLQQRQQGKAPSLANGSPRPQPSAIKGPARSLPNGDNTRKPPEASEAKSPTGRRRGIKLNDANAPTKNQTDPDDNKSVVPSEGQRSRPIFGSGERIRNPRGTYVVKDPAQLPPVREFHEDDVQPHDSISNIGLPRMRATSELSLQGGYKPAHLARPASDVDYNLTKDRYFQSLREQHPAYAPSTPKPHMRPLDYRDNRVYEGHYYDRRNGQTYKYNIDMGKRSIVSERRPNG